jgi:glucosamine--fructose-6-phosphate aminotransferase (isomerizing)
MNCLKKPQSNIREVAARGGKIILVSDAHGISQLQDVVEFSIEMPEISAASEDAANLLNPILYAVPCQLLAYHVACDKGTDVDQPRNLAKSVTVE